MQKRCRVLVNGQEFFARRGELLLDAALVNGVELPHDCRSGHCGTCLVRVIRGLALGGDSAARGMVHACRTRIVTDLELMVEPVPEAVITRGAVSAVRPLAPDVVEARVSLAEPVDYLPGQYYKVQFRGYPARCFSPTAPMAMSADEGALRFHIRQVPGGRVSSAVGREITKGHGVKLEGPFGNAYLRPNLRNRLVLVSSGTGFAPIWSIAEAALRREPGRTIVVVASARDLRSFYMKPALRLLNSLPNVAIIPVLDDERGDVSPAFRRGWPAAHMPALRGTDIVYACGGPKMVESIKDKAVAAGATFYADPFLPQSDGYVDTMVFKAIGRLANLLPSKANLPAPQTKLRLDRPRTPDQRRRPVEQFASSAAPRRQARIA